MYAGFAPAKHADDAATGNVTDTTDTTDTPGSNGAPSMMAATGGMSIAGFMAFGAPTAAAAAPPVPPPPPPPPAPPSATPLQRSGLGAGVGAGAGAGLGFSGGAGAGADPGGARKQARRSAPPVKVSRDFAKFERHSKGFGMAYLKKFGFKPGQGLGTDGNKGITQPILPSLAVNQKAGVGSAAAASHLGTKDSGAREFERKAKAARREAGDVSTDSESDDDDPGGGGGGGGGGGSGGWRANAPSRPKRPRKVYKTAAEILRDAAEGRDAVAPLAPELAALGGGGAAGVGPIVDMRGKSAKVLTSMADGVTAAHDSDGGSAPSDDERSARAARKAAALQRTVAKELLHNTRKLADLSEVNLHTLTHKHAKEETAVVVLTHDLQRLEARLAAGNARVDAFAAAVDLVDRATDAAAAGKLSVDAAATVMETLRTKHGALASSLRLEQLGPALLRPALAAVARGGRSSASALDPAVVHGLARWQDLVTPEQYSDAVHRVLRGVVPQLVQTLRSELEVNPAAQQLDAWHKVMAWGDILPPPHLACLVEGELMPKWFTALATWLSSPDADLTEVQQWYAGWRSLLEPFLTDAGVVAGLHRALDIMLAVAQAGTAAAGAAVAAKALARPPPSGAVGYFAALHRRNTASDMAAAKQRSTAARRRQPPPPARKPAAVPRPHITFREALERLAAKAGLSMHPHPRRTAHGGNRLYLFGAVPVYIADDVAFAEDTASKAANPFAPIHVDALLRRATAAAGR